MMMKIKKISKSIGILLGLISMHTYAQQDAQFTQYMYNTMSVNPAYAGTRGQLSILALYRSQWVSLKGAPKSQTFLFHTPINNSRLGYGLSVVNDEIGAGVNQETSFDGAVSYYIPTSAKGKLSFGLKFGGHLLNVDYSKLHQISGEEEPIDQHNIDNKFSPNIGAGLYYHTQKFYVGLSVPNMLETEHFDKNLSTNGSSTSYIATERINYYLITGYVFDLNADFKFKPAMLLKAVSGAPLQLDLSANMMYKEKFTLGAAYRFDAAVSAMMGFQVSQRFMFGMAYDAEVSSLGGTNYGNSFEIFVRYELVKAVDKLLSPRFF